MGKKNPERRQQAGAVHCSNEECNLFTNERLTAKTYGQKEYIKTIIANHVTICTGPAGSGKTHIPCGLAAEAFRKKMIRKIVLTRPVGSVEKALGYLPGDIASKMDPYLRPLFDELSCYFTYEAIKHLVSTRQLEIVPLSAMRGRTFKDSFIVLDEAQLATYSDLKMFFTRFGEGSKVVASGDLKQTDLPPEERDSLSAVMDRIHHLHGVGVCHLTHDDVVRHRLTSEIDRSL